MAEQRQPFRFRLPWLPAPAAPRPSPTPTPAQPAPTQSATAAPILRPPFRPPGIVQVQPPPPPPPPPPQDQAQAAPRTESEVQSPPLAAVRSPPLAAARSPPFVAARSPPFAAARSPPFAAARSPPLAAARSPVTSQPTSPTRAEYQFRTGSVPSSPSRGPSQYAGPTSSQPTSPSRVPPTSQVVSQPASPSRRLQSSIQESSQAPPTYRRPQTLATGPEEMKPAVSQMWSQEPQTKAQITTETPKSQDQNILGTTVVVAAPKAPAPPQKSDSSTLIDDAKPVGEYDQISKASQVDTQEPQSKAEIPSWTLPTSRVVAQPSQAPGPVAAALPTSAAIETPSGPQKPDSYAVTSVWKRFSSEPKSEETEERKKVEQELIKEEKTNGPAYETPKQRAEAEIHTITPQIKEQQAVTFPGLQKQPGKREILDRKEILLTSGTSGKQSKTVISTHPKDRSPVSEPRPKPATFNGERAPLHKEIREDISKFVHKLTTGHPKQPMDEKPISITNLVGENRGASMHFVPESAKKDASLHIHRGYKANTDEGGVENIEGEGSSREDSMIKEVEATKAYINSNVQSINNSIFCDAAVTERNPGVQLGISCTPTAQAKFGCKEEPLEAHKAEFSVTPSQKLTYEPVIKRRCLRGLFLESSDSDPDNPEKPKRHGCRYSSGEKSKGNNTDVV